jgi:hypothetical protein
MSVKVTFKQVFSSRRSDKALWLTSCMTHNCTAVVQNVSSAIAATVTPMESGPYSSSKQYVKPHDSRMKADFRYMRAGPCCFCPVSAKCRCTSARKP